MTITHWLATLDLLCTRDLPVAPGTTDVGTAGPGYLVAELRTSGDFTEDGGAEREETAAQYECDRDGLAERLAERWGAPDVFSLRSAFERAQGGEDIPEPWASLSAHVPDVQVWRPPGTARWVALGVSRWGDELPFQLLAVVTETDPP
ncbi:hypothetical protein [Streptomyces sp. NPDC005423]|uniref:hypothetical protein n=1 Tax=Streptomyces sp. NPDC005423 TaxID=3155343 RepID=UPI0033A4B245